jgi:hypothetical protein
MRLRPHILPSNLVSSPPDPATLSALVASPRLVDHVRVHNHDARRLFHIALSASFAIGAVACESKLSTEVATALVQGQSDFATARCSVEVEPFAQGRWRMLYTQKGCTDELASAGYLTIGKCDPAYNYICNVEVFPSSKCTAAGHWLSFECGTTSLKGVDGIANNGREATFRYERTVTTDEKIVKSVPSCRLSIEPAPGTVWRDRTARRDDEGHWALVEK